ncbi:transposase, IS605 OrfB family [Methanohalobium evestigatum Z-7303]|uniref:Transposase, IS605 OrfB family n=1 Tax=Methanohalobium evestigatum (strain ATCC BAA-1072 / DSM 3721 / NBRC 107634 / OCM 161 / Z-7303) TaxID=644295 RepID=D7E7K1_METEZ|nr:RNA-guided endonuclease TnpB family protein [Methanohalobium evestigatum]ADI74074.1 transposase, IS605 OrfB family [Methanohalobium evestigatum Z-7303]
MYLTQKNHLRADKQTYETLKRLTKLSKNLYNFTLYNIRQYFFNYGKYLNKNTAYHTVKENENYRLMPSQVAQNTVETVDGGMKSFFKLLDKKRKGEYEKPVSLPKYLAKDGNFICTFKKDQLKVIDDKIRLSLGPEYGRTYGTRYLYFKIPDNILGQYINQVRIVPKYKGRWFEIDFVYHEDGEIAELDYNSHLSIDLGVDNFATCVTTSGTAFILDGRGIKSYNRWWNKEKSRLQSVYDKQDVDNGIKMDRFSNKRFWKINDFMNQCVNHIVKHCLENRIGNVVIGELKEIKQEQNIGKENTQNFQTIPFARFKYKLASKCKYHGIKYQEVDEAYTSKVDALALELIKKHKKYLGKRPKRGIFQSSTGRLINADINGALNILRKVIGDSLAGITDSGDVNSPGRIRLSW